MITLLRYAFVKGFRDHSLLPVLLGPLVMMASPILGVGIFESMRGRGGFPFAFYKGSTAPQIAAITLIAAGVAILAGGIAAFLSFRSEIMSHSIGFLVLARRPVEIVAAAAIAGTLVGVTSFAGCVAAIALLMGGISHGVLFVFAMTAVGSLVISSAGILLVSISFDTGMILPLAAVAIPVAIFVLDSHDAIRSAWAGAAALVLALAASFVLERRCAG
jgi:hypothetical protein